MINASREDSDIGTAKLTMEVLQDGENVHLSTIVVDFTGYGGFKIIVTPKVGPGASKDPVIITGGLSSRKRQDVIDEALVVAMAPPSDQQAISQQVQSFLFNYLKAEPEDIKRPQPV